MSADPFAATPDAVACEAPIERRPRRRKALIDKLGTVEPPAKKKRKKPVVFDEWQAKWFTNHGWTPYKCEYTHHVTRRKHDVWTFGDWLACKPGEGAMLVQTCRHSDRLNRARKAEATAELRVWLLSGNQFEVHGWAKNKSNRWQVTRLRVVLDGDSLKREVIE